MEDDEDVSTSKINDKSSIQLRNDLDDTLQADVTVPEQCESVQDSLLAGELEAVVGEDVGGVKENEKVGALRVGDEFGAGSPKNGVVDERGSVQIGEGSERCESVIGMEGIVTTDGLKSSVAEDGNDTEVVLEEKVTELGDLSEEKLELGVSSEEKLELRPELDEVKLVVESQSAALDVGDSVDSMVDVNEENLPKKGEKVLELDEGKVVVEPELVEDVKDDGDSIAVKKDEVTVEVLPDVETSQLVNNFEASVLKDEEKISERAELEEKETVGFVPEGENSHPDSNLETSLVKEDEFKVEEVDPQVEVGNPMVISELTGSQPDQESEVASVKEGNGDESVEEEDTQMDVAGPDESQLMGEIELSDAKEANVEGIVAEEQGKPTAKGDKDMVDEEEQTPTANVDEDAEEQETPTADTEMEVGRAGGKRKRGKNSKVATKVPARKTVGEDVCFICFDGGDLVLCDRRGCPKAYHPSCVNRDEAFFRSKGRWNCGWHQCSICEKNTYYSCYTCTYSLCKGCIKDAVILCVRGNKGFCETCMKTVMMIEKNELIKDDDKVDFDDKSSWEFLFKDYWSDLKAKLSLTLDEVAQAKSPRKVSDAPGDIQESPAELYDANNEGDTGSDNPSWKKSSTSGKRKLKKKTKSTPKEEDSVSDSDNFGNIEASKSKRRKGRKMSKSRAEKDAPSAASALSAGGTSAPGRTEWASNQLLEFVMHMKDGATSVLSQFDVQALLLEYIKRNKLRDPRRKSQIICDVRLQKLFGKPRVGHFEMLKLLESHFLIREDSQIDDFQGTVVDTDNVQLDVDGGIDSLTKVGKDRKRKARRKGDGRALHSNMDDYAAIDTHNISLVYLRRNVIEALLEDSEYFNDKVVGSFVRIRISGSNIKQELYRLVQVVGTSKAAAPYKVVKRTTDMVLEIQNLNKKEIISMDIISNQDFTEDECKRLRQSIKCGLVNRLTLGDIYEKSMVLQEVRVNDWLEAEVVRLSHLRDRASETGRRKELRECVEKLQRLRTPEERQRRLEEIPEVHSDPKMDPSYESDEEEYEPDDNKQDNYMRPRSSGFSRSGREPISPQMGGSGSNDSGWSGTRNSSITRELSRNVSSRGFPNRREDSGGVAGYLGNENNSSQERNRDRQQLNSWDQPKSETSPTSLPVPVTQAIVVNFNETDKMWLYKDPSGKIQGPFTMVQLRKWSNTGYFPKDLKIWKNDGNQDESVLLTNALTGNFQKEPAPSVPSPHIVNEGKGLDSYKGNASLTVDTSRFATNGWNSDHTGRNDASNLPSPTPTSRTTAGDSMSPVTVPLQMFSSAPKTPQSGGFDGSNISRAGFSQQTNKEQHEIQYSGVISSSVLTQSSQNESPISFPKPSSLVPPENLQFQTNAAVSAEPNANTQSINMYNPYMESHGQPSTSEQNNQNPTQVQQSAYSQWGTVNPGLANQVSMQPSAQPNTPFIMGHQNMAWAGPTVPANTNMNWAPTVQGPAPTNQTWVATGQVPAPGSMNPNWAAPNANPTWVGPVPGNTNQGWVQPGNMFQGWVASSQGSQPINANQSWVGPNNTNPGWFVPPGQLPAPGPGNVNSGWVAPNQVPTPGNSNMGWVPPNPNQNRPMGNGGRSDSSRSFNSGGPRV